MNLRAYWVFKLNFTKLGILVVLLVGGIFGFYNFALAQTDDIQDLMELSTAEISEQSNLELLEPMIYGDSPFTLFDGTVTSLSDFSSKIDHRVIQSFLKQDTVTGSSLQPVQPKKESVFIYVEDEEMISDLPQNVIVKRSYENIVNADLSLDEINQLAQLDSVTKIRLPYKPIFADGISEGVASSMADVYHANGLDGAGVVIAIIDSGFFQGILDSYGNANSVTIDKSSVTSCPNLVCGNILTNSHGTAVGEIILNMAPGVTLLLYPIVDDMDTLLALQDAKDMDADIITASLRFPEVPPDGVSGYFRDGTSELSKKGY